MLKPLFRFFRAGTRNRLRGGDVVKRILLALILAMALPAAVAAQVDEAVVAAAVEAGDFGKPIDLSMPRAKAGDPEFQFAVGYLIMLWHDAPEPKATPSYSAPEGMDWIRRAAAQGLPQAAGFLRDGYSWGRHTLPKDPVMADCWRKVEGHEQPASACMDRRDTRNAAECQRDFLSSDGDWQASTFDGERREWNSSKREFDEFTPIGKLYVRKGNLHAKTWGGEPVSARLSAQAGQLLMHPHYLDWLGIDDAFNRKAEQVHEYAAPGVKHVLSISGDCRVPATVRIDIGPIDGTTRSVVLSRVPTSAAQFEVPVK